MKVGNWVLFSFWFLIIRRFTTLIPVLVLNWFWCLESSSLLLNVRRQWLHWNCLLIDVTILSLLPVLSLSDRNWISDTISSNMQISAWGKWFLEVKKKIWVLARNQRIGGIIYEHFRPNLYFFLHKLDTIKRRTALQVNCLNVSNSFHIYVSYNTIYNSYIIN